MNCPEKKILFFFTHPTPGGGGGGGGSKFQKSGKFPELPRKSINILHYVTEKLRTLCIQRPFFITILILLPPVHVTGNQLVINNLKPLSQ